LKIYQDKNKRELGILIKNIYKKIYHTFQIC